LRWLQQQGCTQFFFKYCSTFDSTAAGNIGQVTEALLHELGADFTIACPAFRETAAPFIAAICLLPMACSTNPGWKIIR